MQLPHRRRSHLRADSPRPADHDVWRLVHAERRALIDDLAGLTPEQWETPSLADGWTVHDVAAHLIDNARTTPWRLTVGMARARGDLDRQNQAGVEAERRPSTAATLDALRSVAGRTTGPPTWMAPSPADWSRTSPTARTSAGPWASATSTRSRPCSTRSRTSCGPRSRWGGAPAEMRRVRLVATDAAITVGEGPEVHGRLLELLMAATGRPWHQGALTGDGVGLLGG